MIGFVECEKISKCSTADCYEDGEERYKDCTARMKESEKLYDVHVRKSKRGGLLNACRPEMIYRNDAFFFLTSSLHLCLFFIFLIILSSLAPFAVAAWSAIFTGRHNGSILLYRRFSCGTTTITRMIELLSQVGSLS